MSGHPRLELAIEQARAAREAGNHPFGAVLADASGEVVLSAQNTVVTDSDVTGHAETNLVRLATRTLGRDLRSYTLYTSTEPCVMCAGAIYWAGISKVVFATAETELAEMTGDDPENPTLTMPCRDVFGAGQRPTEVLGPFDLPGARAVHEGFWRS
ncbi:MAG: nucleoside deaminase [Microlunatus sp.]|nr:nucleoside deaminase [Microlunatus sp.]MDN5769483.1 nucleoside deaminase [Microlunatus sp.]MDN5804179.1 nucleoside deaminase [Microlunatus sp.]